MWSSSPRKEYPNHKYYLINNKNEVELIEGTEEKDMGLSFDNQLNFKQGTQF